MAQRRENGKGSVCRRKDGRWQARTYLGVNEVGEPIRKYFYGSTESEALRKMEKGIDIWQEAEENRKYTRGKDNTERKKYKMKAYANGELVCAVCGWDGLGWSEIIEAHHIIPFTAGGRVSDENMVFLCPNHHGIAHFLMRVKTSLGGEPFGCKNELVGAVKGYEIDYANRHEKRMEIMERCFGGGAGKVRKGEVG